MKSLLREKKLRIVGCHNALGANLIERAGFEGLWLSSFELHASANLPDADILTISDYADATNKICDRVDIPLIVDGDAGGGSPINTIRMTREYEKNGAMGLCIEDNVYPKRCSFYEGVHRELEPVKSFCGKIKAACDSKKGSEFIVVARTETLIQGRPLSEAIDRCSAYVEAGADAVLIHDKRGEATQEVLGFGRRFDKAPIFCVPTKYGSIAEETLYNSNISAIIYANVLLRTTIEGMEHSLNELIRNKKLDGVTEMCDLDHVYDIIALEKLRINEGKYK